MEQPVSCCDMSDQKNADLSMNVLQGAAGAAHAKAALCLRTCALSQQKSFIVHSCELLLLHEGELRQAQELQLLNQVLKAESERN